MTRSMPLFFLCAVVLLAGGALTYLKPSESLPVFGEVSDFSLVDSDGATFKASELKGKVWLVSFFFSRCQGVCPAVNGRISRIVRDFSAPRLPFEVISITVDPGYDTPEVLQGYSKRFEAPADRWKFLTGDTQEISRIADEIFKLGRGEDVSMHSSRIVLVDSQMRMRGFYRGEEPSSVQTLEKDLKSLL
jgi:protein SCO1